MKLIGEQIISQDEIDRSNGEIIKYAGEMIRENLSRELLDTLIKGRPYIVELSPNKITDNPADLTVSYKQYISVEDLVRCRDCRHGTEFIPGFIACRLHVGHSLPPNGYCFLGERR